MSESGIFKAAVKLSPESRAAYLEQACGANQELRREVESLLRAHDDADSFLQSHAACPSVAVEAEPTTEQPGTIIGPYKLLERIGEGGMGTVYMAEQQQPVRRMVALKIIKAGMDSAQVIARFEAERQALALMDHPNIAKVLDAGTTASGRPFFVMELVKGTPITDFCDQNRLTPRERLELFVPVCQAIQHAHQKGVIHRDIKPSNVLVALYDGQPVPKVIDFGIAKATDQRLTDKTLFTKHGQIVGTFEYMSPEQATLDALDVDTRSDVYSLGVLLYELLTGTTPLDKERLREAALGEVLRLIREEEPQRPSNRLSAWGGGLPMIAAYRKTESQKLPALVRGDLDWIVMKGLEKNRTRRYETASALAADVRRYLSEEPIEARPPSAAYRLGKFVKRHRGPVLAAAVVLLALVVGVIGTTWGMVEAVAARNRAVTAEGEAKTNEQKAKEAGDEALRLAKEEKAARKLAQANETKAEWRLYASNIASAQREWETDNLPRFYHYLEQCRPDFRGWEHDYLYTLSNSHGQTLIGHPEGVSTVVFSPDGKLLASASNLGTVKLWNTASRREVCTIKPGTGSGRVGALAFSPDGKRLATAAPADPIPPSWTNTEVKFWDTATGERVGAFNIGLFRVASLAFSPDGKLVAGVGEVLLGKPLTPAEIRRFDAGEIQRPPRETVVRVWDATSGEEKRSVKLPTKLIGLALSPDSNLFAGASSDGTVKLWDLATGKEGRTLHEAKAGTINAFSQLAFTPDSKSLVSASTAQHFTGTTLTLWDVATGEAKTFESQSPSFMSVAVSPDGKFLATVALAQGPQSRLHDELKLWDTATRKEVPTFKGGTDPATSLAFSPDGKRLASACRIEKVIKLWDIPSPPAQVLPLTLKPQSRGSVLSVAFSPDGKRLVSGGAHFEMFPGGDLAIKEWWGDLKLWDPATGKEALKLIPDPSTEPIAGSPLGHKGEQGGYIRSVAFSPDGKLLASGSWGAKIELQGDDYKVKDALKLWDATTGTEIRTFEGPTNQVSSVAFSRDGTRLASAGGNKRHGELKLWEVATGKAVVTLKGHRRHVWSVAFSPDGKLLASGSSDLDMADNLDEDALPLIVRNSEHGEVRLWDATTGKEVNVFKASGHIVMSVAFSPDSKLLASGSSDGTVQLWDLATGKVIRTLEGHTGAVSSLAFSPDGTRLASGGAGRDDKTVRLWDVVSGQEVLTLRHTWVTSVAFSRDGKRLAGGSADGTIIIWDASKPMFEPLPK